MRMVVTMLGVDPSCLGGISTLARLLSTELAKCSDVDFLYISTVNQKSAFAKIACFCKALGNARQRFAHKRGIVHVHMADNASVLRSCMVIRMARLYNQVIILHIHCDLAKIRRASPKSMQKMIDWAILNSDRVIVLGSYLDDLFSILGYSQEKVLVLPNAVPCAESNPYTTDRQRILFLGNISEEKGVVDLLDALALIDASLDSDLRVDLCGKDHIGIQEEIAKRKLNHRVSYYGIVKPDTQFFSKYLLNVLPSHREAMPFALLESSAQGIPSIATTVGSISEIIDSGKSGWLVAANNPKELADQLQYVLKRPNLLISASNQVHRTIRERYAVETYMHKLLSLYLELMV